MLNINKEIRKIALASATIFSLGMVVQPAFAAESDNASKGIVAEAGSDMDFKKLDVNSDQKISLKEAVKDKSLATAFDATDMNKDGSITPDEYSSYKASMQLKGPDGKAPAVAPEAKPAS